MYLLKRVNLIVGDAPHLVHGTEAALPYFVERDEVHNGGARVALGLL